MGVRLSRAEVVSGLEPTSDFTVEGIRAIFNRFEDCCPSPALWERAFYELMGCFSSPEAVSKAFVVLDTDANGLVDARETLASLAVLSKGHLKERMALVFDIFDLNKEGAMTFDECFLLLRRTMGGLRKMIAIAIPPEKVIYNMTKQVWKMAKKHKDTRLVMEDWHSWWSTDASIRAALKMMTWKPEDQRGLPTPDHFHSVDYTSGMNEFDNELDAKRASKRSPSRPTASPRPSSNRAGRSSGAGPQDDKRDTITSLQIPGSRAAVA